MTKPKRTIQVFLDDTLVHTAEATSLRRALEDYSGEREFPDREVIIVGNVMSVNGVTYTAKEAR